MVHSRYYIPGFGSSIKLIVCTIQQIIFHMPTKDHARTTPINVWGMKPRNKSSKKPQNIECGVFEDCSRGGIPME